VDLFSKRYQIVTRVLR